MKKKSYIPIESSVIRVESAGPVLTGSLTIVPVQIGTVEVQDMDAGFSEDGNDIKNISFD